MTLAESKDFGQNKLTALSLLRRHKHLQDKTQSIEGDVHELKRTNETLKSAKAEESKKLMATEMWEDEPFEKTEIKKVIEEL